MNITTISYKTKTASEEEIFLHLKECSNSFIPNLGEVVNIQEYSKKLFHNSITFEAWVREKLIGLVAGYFNNTDTHSAYITNVSVNKEYNGLGLASLLLQMCIIHAKLIAFSEINLEVNKTNITALHMYKKHGFEIVERKGSSFLMKLNFDSE